MGLEEDEGGAQTKFRLLSVNWGQHSKTTVHLNFIVYARILSLANIFLQTDRDFAKQIYTWSLGNTSALRDFKQHGSFNPVI